MARYQRNNDDDDDFDENGILRDGRTFRVPMRALDSLQRDVAEHFGGRKAVQAGQKIVDGYGQGGLALNRPGFRMNATGQNDQSFYDEYDARIATAYRDADHTAGVEGAGEREFVGKRVGDRCVCKGRNDLGRQGDRGHIAEIDGELVCVSDNHREDGVDMRDAAYKDYDQQIADAWRNPPTR